MRSNCNIWAWNEFNKDRATALVLRKTSYSRWSKPAKSLFWRITLRPIGLLVGSLSWILVQLSWVLMYGHWAHVSTDTHEYIPIEDKTTRWFPPIIYKGKVKSIDHT